MRILRYAVAVLMLTAASSRAQIPGFTATEVQTLGDLNYTARVQLNNTGPIRDRLYALAMAMKNQNGTTVISWKLADADPGYILGFMADTNFGGVDGHDPYNRSLVDRLAGYLAVPVKLVTWPSSVVVAPPAPAPSPPAAPAPTGGSIDSLIRAIVRDEIAKAGVSSSAGTATFDVIRANKICLGDAGCNPDWSAQLQCRGNTHCIIGFEANLAHVDPQDPTHTHVGNIGVSTDGGLRFNQNAAHYFSRGFVTHLNPCRAWVNVGNDSRGGFSLYKGSVNESTCTPIPHDPSQDLVFLPDEGAKEFRLFFPRPGWNVRLLGSTTVNAGDISLQPKQ